MSRASSGKELLQQGLSAAVGKASSGLRSSLTCAPSCGSESARAAAAAAVAKCQGAALTSQLRPGIAHLQRWLGLHGTTGLMSRTAEDRHDAAAASFCAAAAAAPPQCFTGFFAFRRSLVGRALGGVSASGRPQAGADIRAIGSEAPFVPGGETAGQPQPTPSQSLSQQVLQQQAQQQQQQQRSHQQQQQHEGWDGEAEPPPVPLDPNAELPGALFVTTGAAISALLAVLIAALGILGTFYAGYVIHEITKELRAGSSSGVAPKPSADAARSSSSSSSTTATGASAAPAASLPAAAAVAEPSTAAPGVRQRFGSKATFASLPPTTLSQPAEEPTVSTPKRSWWSWLGLARWTRPHPRAVELDQKEEDRMPSGSGL